MARKRQLDPIYPFEKEIASMSIPARYFYVLSWCQMDDTNGVLPYDPFMLKTQIFPADKINIEDFIQETIRQKRLFPFEADGKRWLWCPTFLKHQQINHPSKRRYPNPPQELKDNYRSTTVVLPQSRMSRVERVENKAKAGASPVLKTALDKVYKAGLNIYALLNKLKKESKIGVQVPDEVLLGVCNAFTNKADIKNDWAWFMETLIAKWHQYNVQKNIEESKLFKNTNINSLKEIMVGIGR